MGLSNFDKKFGKEFLDGIPTCPGVYLIYNAQEELIYVGKAKNLRRRLQQYRNAKRRKKHRKMRVIVGEAARLEFRTCGTDLEACLQETELIQAHRPRWNVAGAFHFLYPMLGLKYEGGNFWLCYTNEPAAFPDFIFHGAFRSRDITREAYFALARLLIYVGHALPKNRRPMAKVPRFSYVTGFRQLPEEWVGVWGAFFKGESRDALEQLVLSLVENAGARRRPREIQELLNALAYFWKHEAFPLARMRKLTAFAEYPVPQKDRDFIFLKTRYLLQERRAARKRGPVLDTPTGE